MADARPTTLAILLALTTYPPLQSDVSAFGWATADEVAIQLHAFGFSDLRAQHVARPLRDLATQGEPILRYVDRRELYCGLWSYTLAPAGAAHIAERMLWARHSRGKGYQRADVAVIA